MSNGYGIKGRQPNPIKTNINSISKSKEHKISMNNKTYLICKGLGYRQHLLIS